MTPNRHRECTCRERASRQRGEGQVGCIVSLFVLVILVAVGLKAVPVYWTDYELKDAAKDIASRASVIPAEAIELQLRTKARDLEIGPALLPGAIKALKTGDNMQGTCTINFKYKRIIEFYGVYQWPVEVNGSVSSPYMSGL